MIDDKKFIIICRIIADGNSPKLSALRVKSNLKEFMDFAEKTPENYNLYCKSFFKAKKIFAHGKDLPLCKLKNKGFNIRERMVLEKYLEKRVYCSKDTSHSH
jgi:hypothetical protein